MIAMGQAGIIAASAATGALFGAAMSHPARQLARAARSRSLLHPAALAAATAAVLAALAWRGGEPPLVLVVDAALAAGCVPLAAIDFAEHRLPTWLVLPLYPVLLVPIGLYGLVRGEPAPFLRAVVGMAALFLFYLVIAILSGELGAGDVRLAGVLGLVLAWHSWAGLVLGTLLGLFTAAATGLIGRLAFNRPRHHRIPLGTALIAGTVAALLAQPASLA